MTCIQRMNAPLRTPETAATKALPLGRTVATFFEHRRRILVCILSSCGLCPAHRRSSTSWAPCSVNGEHRRLAGSLRVPDMCRCLWIPRAVNNNRFRSAGCLCPRQLCRRTGRHALLCHRRQATQWLSRHARAYCIWRVTWLPKAIGLWWRRVV